jgi:hypothetical protein
MSFADDEPPSVYDLKAIERAICEHPELGELGVHLSVHGGRIHVQGGVASEPGRQAVLELVRGRCGTCEVVDELDSADDTLSVPPRRSEELR